MKNVLTSPPHFGILSSCARTGSPIFLSRRQGCELLAERWRKWWVIIAGMDTRPKGVPTE